MIGQPEQEAHLFDIHLRLPEKAGAVFGIGGIDDRQHEINPRILDLVAQQKLMIARKFVDDLQHPGVEREDFFREHLTCDGLFFGGFLPFMH